MVCKANDNSVKCQIQKFSYGTKEAYVEKITMLRTSMFVKDIYKHILDLFSLEPDTFKIFLCQSRSSGSIKLDLSTMKDKMLSEIGVDFSNNIEIELLVIDAAGRYESQKCANLNIHKCISASTSSHQSSTWGEDNVHFKTFVKPETSYVGLVNQAMTCYLNSLLQALYMTPEFRNALYNYTWENVEGSNKDERNSIPYQLQKLFLNLQTSTKSAVETISLTKSFGWDSAEAWQQHDIQELCRVMFDALEQKFKNTEQADLINRLYEGKMIDYVKCLECGTEKSREDTFLDIPLSVRPFGSNVAYNSVEEAMRAFVQYETLEGANQYHCEKCNKKCDAHKGLKFTKFPYLLTLHLKRFDFDYKTCHRIKLNDKVTFPDVLDLNSFIQSTSNQESPAGDEDIGVGVKCDDSSTTDSGTLDDDCPPCNSFPNSNNSVNHDQDDDEGIDMSNGPSTSNCSMHNHENEKHRGSYVAGRGPYQYELFSIMIHSGSASGGHYYAYIKDFKTQEWLCFNDQSVTQITRDDIQKTYGGGPTRAYYSAAYSSSTNAYMLMYRQIDRTRNALPMQEKDFPPHIKDLLKKMKESEDNDRRNQEKRLSLLKLKAYCHHPTEGKLLDTRLCILPDSTWAQAMEMAYRKFGLENVVSLDQCRLVSYDRSVDMIECSYDGKEQETVASIWQNSQNRFDLLLEIRRKDQKFETYLPGGVANKVYVVDVPRQEVIDGPINVRGLLTQTVGEYKNMLGKIINMDPKQMKLVLRKYPVGCVLVENDVNFLQTEEFHNAKKIFVSTMLDTENKPFFDTTLYKITENFENVISLQVQLPDTSKEILDELNIPSLDDKYKDKEKAIVNDPSKLLSVNEANNEAAKCNETPKGGSNDDISIRILSPQLGEGEEWNTPEQSNSEDSSLSDSDKTLVGDAPEDDDFPLTRISCSSVDSRHFRKSTQIEIENWDIDDDSEYYFKAMPYTNGIQQQNKLLKVLVDKRVRLGTLKKDLEPYVGVPVEYFKVFRQSNDTGETECSCLTEQLGTYDDGERLNLKLGRALRNGEFKVKLYQLLIDSAEPYKSLCEWIVSKDMTVGQAKREILTEIKRKYNIDIPYERCRLRKKNYKTASKVFLDDQKFEDLRFSQCEMIVQELPDKEPVTNNNQIVLFVRRWSPSMLQLGPFQEIVIDGKYIDELRKKIFFISDIPEEYIDVAKGRGQFPCDMSVLKVQNEHDWIEHMMTVDGLPFNFDDGSVFLYRDRREKLRSLTNEELKEISSKENARLAPLSTISRFSPRREGALKIHWDTK